MLCISVKNGFIDDHNHVRDFRLVIVMLFVLLVMRFIFLCLVFCLRLVYRGRKEGRGRRLHIYIQSFVFAC